MKGEGDCGRVEVGGQLGLGEEEKRIGGKNEGKGKDDGRRTVGEEGRGAGEKKGRGGRGKEELGSS